MENIRKLPKAMLACIFLASCSESEQTVVPNEVQSTEFLGGGACSEHVLYDEAVGIPASITSSENYFECSDGDVESLVSIAPGSMPTGTGSVTFNGETLSTDSAAVEFFFDDEFENHKGIQLYLHNGAIKQAEKRFEQFDDTGAGVYRHEVRYGIYAASYVLSVELGSFSLEKFEVGTFEYTGNVENPSDPLYANSNIIFSATAFYDVNGNGAIDALEEILDIESGHVTITGEWPDWSITADVQLSNGNNMTGQYFGNLVEILRAEQYVPEQKK